MVMIAWKHLVITYSLPDGDALQKCLPHCATNFNLFFPETWSPDFVEVSLVSLKNLQLFKDCIVLCFQCKDVKQKPRHFELYQNGLSLSLCNIWETLKSKPKINKILTFWNAPYSLFFTCRCDIFSPYCLCISVVLTYLFFHRAFADSSFMIICSCLPFLNSSIFFIHSFTEVLSCYFASCFFSFVIFHRFLLVSIDVIKGICLCFHYRRIPVHPSQ